MCLPQGRLPGLDPVGIIDIGSNSVRLVVYEGLNRSPTPLFNEKTLCALGAGLAESGRISESSTRAALSTMSRFRSMAAHMGCLQLEVFATAAARDAENGPEFIARAEEVCGCSIRVLSGREEARLAALGVVSGFHQPRGMIGDLGGGSLELVDIDRKRPSNLRSLPLGALRLRDMSDGNLSAARGMVEQALNGLELRDLSGLPFYAVGGTWRAFAKVHMATVDYPLRVIHGYRIKAKHAIALAREVARKEIETLPGQAHISRQRAALMPYGAIVLGELLRRTGAHSVVLSALGVREGMLYTLLDQAVRRQDPLLAAAREFALLRARSPAYADELCGWTDRLFTKLEPRETAEGRRIRHAACWLDDIGWRAHPDYRGEQSLNIVANASFTGVDHASRAILALTLFYRHAGFAEEEPGAGLRHLVDLEGVQRAAKIGASLRLAHRLSGSVPGILNHVHFRTDAGTLAMILPRSMASFAGERLENRLARLGKLAGLRTVLTMTES